MRLSVYTTALSREHLIGAKDSLFGTRGPVFEKSSGPIPDEAYHHSYPGKGTDLQRNHDRYAIGRNRQYSCAIDFNLFASEECRALRQPSLTTLDRRNVSQELLQVLQKIPELVITSYYLSLRKGLELLSRMQHSKLAMLVASTGLVRHRPNAVVARKHKAILDCLQIAVVT